jgi:signal transduction histidine kinase
MTENGIAHWKTRGVTNQSAKVGLEIVRSATDSLLCVINDLLDFSEMEAGKLELDPVEFCLRDHITEILALFSLWSDVKGLELACRIQPEVPNQLIGDSARLRQIIANLVGNAIKFTSRGAVVVDVEAAPQVEGNERLPFRVTDSGIGIPVSKRRANFAPFAQVDGSTTRLYGGTGLGLAISSQLTRLMGGQIWVDSEVGRGSTFQFTAHLAPAQTVSSTADPSLSSLRGPRVLVVDDNAVSRRIL